MLDWLLNVLLNWLRIPRLWIRGSRLPIEWRICVLASGENGELLRLLRLLRRVSRLHRILRRHHARWRWQLLTQLVAQRTWSLANGENVQV